MNSTTLRLLGFVVAFLVIALFLIESSDDGALPESGNLLFPDMTDALNDVRQVTIERSGEDPVSISRDGDLWRVDSRAGYPAALANIREVLVAMAEANVVEPKTANPDLHGRLGVTDPDVENSKGVRVTATADEQSFSLIFGNVSQGNYRYARIAGEDQSWLIDQNPGIPATGGDWLAADIIDIDSDRVQSVTIVHPDGEIIAAGKASEDETNFAVADIPAGRELSYSTVANGLAGALNDLDLDDVREAVLSDAASVNAAFYTFDDLKITVSTVTGDDGNWLTIEAAAEGDDTTEADEINARTSGWQYKIADYKANLLTRRWEDILKPVETEAPDQAN